jgi:hypothetical protein
VTVRHRCSWLFRSLPPYIVRLNDKHLQQFKQCLGTISVLSWLFSKFHCKMNLETWTWEGVLKIWQFIYRPTPHFIKTQNSQLGTHLFCHLENVFLKDFSWGWIWIQESASLQSILRLCLHQIMLLSLFQRKRT